jgi:hypothetical protein
VIRGGVPDTWHRTSSTLRQSSSNYAKHSRLYSRDSTIIEVVKRKSVEYSSWHMQGGRSTLV